MQYLPLMTVICVCYIANLLDFFLFCPLITFWFVAGCRYCSAFIERDGSELLTVRLLSIFADPKFERTGTVFYFWGHKNKKLKTKKTHKCVGDLGMLDAALFQILTAMRVYQPNWARLFFLRLWGWSRRISWIGHCISIIRTHSAYTWYIFFRGEETKNTALISRRRQKVKEVSSFSCQLKVGPTRGIGRTFVRSQFLWMFLIRLINILRL